MASSAEQSIFEILVLGERLLDLSYRGEAEADDDSERTLFAVVRDCAFKVMAEARKELLKHKGDKREARERMA